MNYTSPKLALAAVLATAGAIGVSSNDAEANSAPAPGSEEYNLLTPYEDFIRNAGRKSGTWCCTMKDGQSRFEVEETGNPETPYRVTLTETFDGARLSEPFHHYIKADSVVDASDGEQDCEAIRERDEAAGKVSTCIAPPMPIIWAYDNVKGQADGTFRVNGETYGPNEVIPVEDYKITRSFCFYYPQFDEVEFSPF